ncbi:MAG: dolichyl-phosphate beta-glucosyltransferase [Candidatus Binatia bacterium]
MSDHVYLSVIIPAYNEAQRLPKTLRRLQEYLAGLSLTYEILVVMDGCSDNTLEVVQGMTRDIRNLQIVDRAVNRGKGHTVKEGMLKASGRVRLFTDADNSTDIAHFEKMIPLFKEGYDLVIASRNSKDAPNADEAVPQAWYKRWTGQLGNLIVQLFAVPGIWDTQCGFKAFRAEVAVRIFSETKIEGWGFDIEVLALARAFNYKIGIIPARWVNDPRSHVRWFDYLRVLGDTLRVRANLRARKYTF